MSVEWPTLSVDQGLDSRHRAMRSTCHAIMHSGRKVDVRLPGTGNSNSHGTRPVHLIITMIKWIRTSRLSMKNSLYALQQALATQWTTIGFLELSGSGQFLDPTVGHTVVTKGGSCRPGNGEFLRFGHILLL